MEADAKLKNCPACGGAASFYKDARRVYCLGGGDECCLTGPIHDPDGAKWNALPRRDANEPYLIDQLDVRVQELFTHFEAVDVSCKRLDERLRDFERNAQDGFIDLRTRVAKLEGPPPFIDNPPAARQDAPKPTLEQQARVCCDLSQAHPMAPVGGVYLPDLAAAGETLRLLRERGGAILREHHDTLMSPTLMHDQLARARVLLRDLGVTS